VALPELVRRSAERRLGEFFRHRIPSHARDEVRLEYEVHGDSITLTERRPIFRALPDEEWSKLRIAQLRFDPKATTWALYSADRNERWHRYDDLGPTLSLDALLDEIDRGPTGIFWG
jgi:hypothetical protein